jgi:hypothetical protein
MTNQRQKTDQIAWEAIKKAYVVEGAPLGYALSGRPANYTELGQMIADRNGDFEHSWSEFLHEFLRYRQASFFAERPPSNLSPGWRAILAGTAEYFSEMFHLETPAWVLESEYTLPDLWDPLDDMFPGLFSIEERRHKAHPIFLKHNVVFEDRNLITL